MTEPRQFYSRYGKRLFDLLVSFLLLPILVPAGFLVSMLVWVSLGRPVLFRQQRVGLYSRPFLLLKFRTMRNERDALGRPAPDAQRVSRAGVLLRKSSLDEIPEFLNILRGEMSLVGPRPLLPEYLPLYSRRQARRHEVVPGLTGLAQVRGRNATTWEERLASDVEYVDSLSFRLDLSILLRTCRTILEGDGISAPGHATMPSSVALAPRTVVRSSRSRAWNLAKDSPRRRRRRRQNEKMNDLDADEIAVLGSGGHAKVVLATLVSAGVKIGGVFDDDKKRWGQSLSGVRIRGPLDEVRTAGFSRAIIAIGDNQNRRRIARDLVAEWTSLMHPAAIVDRSVRMGAGSVVFAGSVIQPDCEIGHHAIVNTSACVDHDCRIASFAHIAPGVQLAGDVRIGEGALVGIGAAVAPGITIGDWARIGAGAAVVEDVPPGTTVVGVPARPMASEKSP